MAKAIESHTPGRFDLVVSCTSPTHWFVHRLADGLSDPSHGCGHFVGSTAASFVRELQAAQPRRGAKVLVFTDAVSTGGLIRRMVRALSASGFQVKGLIGLLDTRTRQELAASPVENETSGVARENTAFLVHIPVQKKRGGTIAWRIDPETLEPVSVAGGRPWTDNLSGIGALALRGTDAANWLVGFRAIRQGHFTHGGHHSELICDVRRVLTRREVRTSVAGRLNLYIRENGIDALVYHNHSNAYLLADMVRELHGSDSPPPRTTVALCRDRHGERSYVLPTVPGVDSAERIMLLDDGFVTGSTIRSLGAAVIERYKRVRELHVIVFVNEMTPAVARYWTALATSEGIVPRTTRGRKRAFLAAKFNFTAFMSLPSRSYSEEDCPLCRQRKECLRCAEDGGRSSYEREFFRLWAREIVPRDVYHDPGVDGGGSLIEARIDVAGSNQGSSDALEMLRLETLLARTAKPKELLAEIGRYPAAVQINCLGKFLRLHGASSEDLRAECWRMLLGVMEHRGIGIHHRMLVIRTCIAEQVTAPTNEEFRELLTMCLPHLADPLVLGGVMAFTRLAFLPGRSGAPLKREDVSTAISRLRENSKDGDIRSSLMTLNEWLVGVSTLGVGAGVLCLRRALLTSPWHQSARDDVEALSECLLDLGKAHSPDASELRGVAGVAMRVLDRFAGLERAARVVWPHLHKRPEQEWQRILRDTQSKLVVLEQLIGEALADKPRDLRRIADSADVGVAYLKSTWLTPTIGYVRRLLGPFFHSIRPVIEEAIEFGNSEHGRRFPSHRVSHTYDDFLTGDGASIEVLCDPTVLIDAVRNIVSNIWKHVVPNSIENAQPTSVTWTCRREARTAMIEVIDNGPGLPRGERIGDHGGYGTIAPAIREYDGAYYIRTDEAGGARVTLQLHYREVPT